MNKLLKLICGTALILNQYTASAAAEAASVVFDSPERTTLFNDNWEFAEAGKPAETVTLPHDWSIDEPFSTEYEAESGFLPGGKGTYTKSVVFPSSYKDKRILLEFEGVYQNAVVTVNGKKLGTHPYGYTSFAFDLSDVLIMDGKRENKITVEVNNPIPGSRWYTGSGIYRDVFLTVTEKQYIAREGVRIETPAPRSGNRAGHTGISVEIGNDSGKEKTVTLRTILLDSVGVPVSNAVSDTVTLAGDEHAVIDQTIELNNPILWSPDNPMQYICRTRLTDETGEVLDTVDTRYGYRWTAFDSKKGFTLNGEPLKLKGVCLHHDFGALGAASMHAAVDYRLDQLKAMGVNAIRSAHNPADGYLLEACSKRGILVIEEAFDTWTNAKNHNTHDYSEIYSETIRPDNHILNGKPGMTWSQYDIQEMVRHSRNEPCVILYSIGNEILGNIGGEPADYPELAEQLCEWVGEMTNTHPVTIADNMTLKDNETQLAMDTAVHQAGGVIGLNYATEESMERYHSDHPKWKLFGSETASAYGSRDEYGTNGIDETRHQVTAFDNAYVEWGMRAMDAWLQTISHDYIAGEFVWTGYDYLGEPEPWNGLEAGSVTDGTPSPNSSYFGIIDRANLPKDAYYFYQSQWRDDITVLHVLPDWSTSNSTKDFLGNTQVSVYTNAPCVELFLNGKSLGKTYAETHVTDAGYSWKTYNGSLCINMKVHSQPGTLQAVAYDEDGNVIRKTSGRSRAVTAGAPAYIKLTSSKARIAGEDLAFVTAVLCDQAGNPVSDAEAELAFHTDEYGVILAADNGDPTNLQPYQDGTASDCTRMTFHGKAVLIVKSGGLDGEMVITASSEGLTSGVIRIGSEMGVRSTPVSRTISAVKDEYSRLKGDQ